MAYNQSHKYHFYNRMLFNNYPIHSFFCTPPKGILYPIFTLIAAIIHDILHYITTIQY